MYCVKSVLMFNGEMYMEGDIVEIMVNNSLTVYRGKITSIYESEMRVDCSGKYEAFECIFSYKNIETLDKILE